MIRFTDALNAWETADFEEVLKAEIAQLKNEQLPLQEGLSTGSYAIDSNLSAMIINTSEDADFIHIKAGIFYSGVVAGCSCADDPTPVNENSEYCLVQFDINKLTAETNATLLAD